MKRRALLSAVAVGTAGLAGCLGTSDSPGRDGTTPATTVGETPLPTATSTPNCPPTVNTGDDHAVPYCFLTRDPNWRGRRTPREGPTFARYHGERATLRIVGGLRYGSSTCDRIALETVELTAEDELRVVVGAASKESAGPTCTDDIDYDEYELVVALDDVPIEAVRVTERPFDAEPTTWTVALVDR